ncbi:MAG: energy transducer TonB [Saprospiraceae bacterium]|nr:energy transducer TonB [Saprospiraceae bacterium]
MQKEKKEKNFIKKPIYEGGAKAMKAFIAKHLKYPPEALAQKTEGTVYLKYSIDHKGKVVDTQVISGIGHGCDEEAERLVKKLEFKVPKNRGVKVLFHKNIQIHFHLPKVAPKQTTTQLQYTLIPQKTTKQDQSKQNDKGGSYSYTITY